MKLKAKLSMLILCIFSNIQQGYCQNEIQSSQPVKSYRFPLQSRVHLSSIKPEVVFEWQALEMPQPGGKEYHKVLSELKNNLPEKLKITFHDRSVKPSCPVIKTGFEGNLFNGHVPNDNDIAISNDGIIVSVINSSIYFFNRDSMIAPPLSLAAFVSSFPMKEGKYDPRVLYDPEANRFILTFLNGFDDSSSYIFLAFSETEDPTKSWNIYTLPGNPLNDSSWSDFPMIALSRSELFYTINLLRNRKPGETWKNTFKQTIIWQIDKNSGYRGDSLRVKLYSQIQYDSVNIRNLCPVPEALKPKEEGMYFLSNRNFSLKSDSFFLVRIQGTIDSPASNPSVKLVRSDSFYGVPPLADQPHKPNQPNWKKLETNDARVLDAFRLNNKIFFAGNTVDFYNNQATIYQGTLDLTSTTWSIHLDKLHHPSLEFGYPSLAYTGMGNNEEHILLVNHTSDSVNPGISALFYKNGKFSDLITVKEGQSKVAVQGSAEQRWGDYTGLQRKYNESGVVWGAGYFGKFRKEFPNQVNATWITELISPTYSHLHESRVAYRSVVFPNPAANTVYWKFTSTENTILTFSLYDMQGKKISLPLRTPVVKGQNLLSIHLPYGLKGYFILRAFDESGKEYLSRKILIN